jgi:hypothetical protein
MKSIIRTFALSAAALAIVAPMQSFADAPEAPYCIAVNGGFGNGGTTFVARNFSLPAANKCSAWTGYTKTADTVILTTSGTACMSSDSTALTTSVTSMDPQFVPIDTPATDYIQMTRPATNEPFSGTDYGYFAGPAAPVSCSSELLNLPSVHD